jgi:hypothetical protein
MSFVNQMDWLDIIKGEKAQDMLDLQTMMLHTQELKLEKGTDSPGWRKTLFDKMSRLLGFTVQEEIKEEKKPDAFQVIRKRQGMPKKVDLKDEL